MTTIRYFILAAAAIAFSGCGTPAVDAPAGNANAANAKANTAKPAATAPTKEELMTLERSGWEAWKNRDPEWTEQNYSDKGFNVGTTGRTEKAEMIKSYSTQKCEIKSYSLSDDQMRMAGPDVAILTFRSAQDAVCDGIKAPTTVRSASIYIREADKWKAAFYAEAAIVDPKAVSTKTTEKKEAPKKDVGPPAEPDAATGSLLPAERAVWEAWKDQDRKRIEDLITPEISFINIFGTYFATRVDALKDWTSHGCAVTSVSVTNAKGTMLSPTAAILTFKGGADGTCFGQKIGPIWGTSVYVKDGEAWKWTFGINVPAK